MRRAILVAGATAVAAVLLIGAARALGTAGVGFAFLVVWLPMAWLGTVSRFVRPQLPGAYHDLRAFEWDGRLYERLGVVGAKRLLRRGPLAVFNPDLHLPVDRTRESLARLDRRMRDAEASHFLLLVATLGVVAHAVARGWWGAAGWTLLFDVLLNGYPVMLQRYNRTLLGKRYSLSLTGGPSARPSS